TILARAQIVPARRWVAAAISLLFVLVMSILLTFLRATPATIVSLTAIPLVLVPLSYAALIRFGVWIDFVTPILAIHWGASAADYFANRHVRRSLGVYVDSEVANKIGVTGDTVNTGARVEALNKEFHTSILITRETLGRLNGTFNVRPLGEVKVKGREKPVEVFEVLRNRLSGETISPAEACVEEE